MLKNDDYWIIVPQRLSSIVIVFVSAVHIALINCSTDTYLPASYYHLC